MSMKLGLIQRKTEMVIDNFGNPLDFSKFKIRYKYNWTIKELQNICSFCLQV